MAINHKSHCAVHDWPVATACDCGFLQERLASALEAIGGMPDGNCFCFNKVRDPSQPDEWHTGECREARAALKDCKEQ